MIIIWGTHHYGQIGGHGDHEHLVTRFGHLYWFPIFPLESRWVTRRIGDQLLGMEVPLSGRSVAATYLRFWAPLAALGLGATLTLWGFAAAAALLALSAWSWTWMRTRRGRERRRAQLNQLTFETACDPSIRKPDECAALRPEIDARFAEVSAGRTPDDVARFGADTPLEGALAYASLRLVAATARGETARRARAASERVLDRLTDRDADALGEGGPYRARQAAGATPDDLEAAAASAVQAQNRAFDEALAAARGSNRTAWDNDPANPAVRAEIARNKAERAWWRLDLSWRGWLLVLTLGPAFAGVVGHKLYTEHVSARRALVELRALTDELCACPTQTCVDDVVNRYTPDEVDRLERTARDGLGTDGDVDDLGRRVEACLDEAASLPVE